MCENGNEKSCERDVEQMLEWLYENMCKKREKVCERVASSGWTEGMIVGWTEA